jgi:hypothetical protein
VALIVTVGLISCRRVLRRDGVEELVKPGQLVAIAEL